MNLFAEYGLEFVPFRLRQEQAETARNWFGGAPKRGVTPPIVEPITRHLCTVGLVDGLDLSLFSTFDYSSLDSRYSFFRGPYRMHDQANPLIQFVVHPMLIERDETSALRNDIKALAFIFGEAKRDPDVKDLDPSAICSDHKVGGLPFFEQLEGEVGMSLELLSSGFVHLLQITFPSKADSLVEVNWPFGEYAFHVFAKRVRMKEFVFRYCWG